MCVTCGCSDEAEAKIINPETGEVKHLHSHTHSHTHSHNNNHDDNHHHEHHHTHVLADGTVVTHSHHHDSSNGKTNTHVHNSHAPEIHAKVHNTTISLEQEVLAKNNLLAAQNRGWFKGRNILALNLMSSPGSGKTTLLTRTLNDLKYELNFSVIEGDQETINDAEKIKETGCQVVQINTGTGCHLDAEMVERGLQQINPPLNSVVMIENVGNLVCPALFDLGEQAKVVILSVTEGEDKPIKYPHIFRASDIMILTKIDLLPHVKFDVNRCIQYALEVNPNIQIFQVSVYTGTGLDNWYQWLKKQR
jgi:hydrogenase nickel incorporation protein HypB